MMANILLFVIIIICLYHYIWTRKRLIIITEMIRNNYIHGNTNERIRRSR